jgi:ComF family protein
MNLCFEALDGVSYLVFPEICPACSEPLRRGEKCLCTSCRFRLPRTKYHEDPNNPVVKHFWGKVKVEAASAYYHFGKGEKVQRVIHHLKYKGRKDVGEFTGELFGYEIMNTPPFSGVDLIVPVPLHLSKLRQRGYNQSDSFAEGIAKAMGVRFDPNALKRVKATSTQTRKHRFERHENVDKVFMVSEADKLVGKHILLVDDVITTGATLIACAESLLEVSGTKVSIGALACA